MLANIVRQAATSWLWHPVWKSLEACLHIDVGAEDGCRMLSLACSFLDERGTRGFVPKLWHVRKPLSFGHQGAPAARSWLAAVASGVVSFRGLSARLSRRRCKPVARGQWLSRSEVPDETALHCDGRDGRVLQSTALQAARRKMESKAAVKRAALERLKDHAASKGGKCISEAYTNCMTKVQWECNLGHTWQATPHSVLNGRRWCPQCAINKGRLSLDQLQAHARKRGGRCLSDEYRNNRTKVRWQCKLGHTWEAVGYSVLNKGTWCPECARTTRSRSNRTLRDLQEHAAARGGKCLATEYVSLRAKVRWRCEKGHTWSATSQSVLNQKTWCPACAKRAPLGLERLRSHAARLGGHCLAEDYKNSYSKVRWKCSYGHVWRAKPRDVFHKGSWCPECQKIGLARLQAHATSLGGRCLCKKYSNRKAKVLWECQLGHRWKASAKHILHQKTWCPQCAVSVWKTEAEIRSILEAIFAPSMFESSYPKFLEGLQLDGYCSELSLAFEYQGEQHYDPDNYFHFGNPSSFDSQLERDDRKRQLCDEAGVRLVLVPCFANDKRLFVLTALLQWFSISDITAPMLSQASR